MLGDVGSGWLGGVISGLFWPGDDLDVPDWRVFSLTIRQPQYLRDDEPGACAPDGRIALYDEAIALDVGDFDMRAKGFVELGNERAVAGPESLRYGNQPCEGLIGTGDYVTNRKRASIVHGKSSYS